MTTSDLLSSPAGDPSPAETPTKRSVSYSTGDHMMAHGASALHEDIAEKVETALGKAFPQMEIRFENLSLTADLVLAHDRHPGEGTGDDELPTLPNHVRQKLAQVAGKKHTVEKHILKNFTGMFKPGTVTLILGQGGSGKSALMKILSGRFPLDKRISLTGSVTYNGLSRDAILKRLPQFVAYVTQQDVHFPTLTVQETLAFAHECCGAELSKRAEQMFTEGTPEENAAALRAAQNVIKNYPQIVMQELGLAHTAQTVVGDAMLRGVSGGERKRVTTGEMEFGLKYVTLMDEITTGLDSAAAFDIINTQRSIAKRLHKTVIISLLQPSPEVFALFDNVLLLNDGEVLYHGPCSEALPYFQSLGFVCPPRRDVADFLCDLGTAQQLPYECGRLPTNLAQYPRHASDFAALFRDSAIFQATLAELRAPVDPVLLLDVEKHITPMPEFYQSFSASTWTLTKRQMLLLWKNQTFLQGRALLVAVMGFLFSSLFYQIDFANVQVVLGVLFASVLFLGLGQTSMLTTFYFARAVFYKQRAANFYRTSSYVLAASVSQLPLAIAESVVFGSLVYWFGGFVDRVGEFLLFELYLMLCILVFLAWFFFLSAIAPNLHVAKPLAMVSLLVFILFAGFVVAKDQIPNYMRWLYWIDPVAWVLRSLAVSQYRSAVYDTCFHKGVTYCTPQFGGKTMGEYSLSLFDVPADKSWAYTGLLFLCGAYLLFMVLAWVTLEYKRYEKPEHIALPKELLDQEAAEAASRRSSPDSEDTVMDGYQTLASPSSRTDQVVLEVEPRASTTRAFQPVTISFQDLWYSVPVPSNSSNATLDLLKGITGYASPGTITALMGSSGAGKTTLMDVIAGRKTGGTIKGKILLNGHEASDLAIRRSTGYCEQMDIHSEAATFREALTFSAFLRQSASVPDAHKYDAVRECLELLDMHDIADHIIRGSSNEQHKRLTIGVELAAQPSVLFLDEPTSGLDARSAKVIMDGVRKVADSGRTILCTIHQPSSEVFHLFDRLLLLKRGGETVYFGPLGFEGRDLIQYFEAMPGVPKIRNGYNPATWMLEVIGAGVGGSSDTKGDGAVVDYVEAYKASETKHAMIDAKLSEPGLFAPSERAPRVTFTNKRAATNAVQLRFLLQRFFTMYWRTPSYNWTRFVISLLLGVVFGLVYLDSEYTTYQGINGGLGMVFLATAFIGIVSFISVLPIAFEERGAFYRERASQTYNALWYYVAFTVVEIPYVCVGALLFTATFYPMVGFTGWTNAAFYWLNTMLHILFQTYMGQFLIFALPSIEVAAVVGVLFNAVFFMLMGFNPPALQIPSGYKWLYAITPHRYTFALLAGTVFGDCSDDHLAHMKQALALHVNASQVPSSWELGCQLIQNAPPSIGNHVPIKVYIDHVFGIKHAHLTQYFGIFMAAIVLFRVLAAFAMRYINHQKR